MITRSKRLNPLGKKGKEWQEARDKLIEQGVKDGTLIKRSDGVVAGDCADCGQFKRLTPDHRKKRAQGGSNRKTNIDWVCWKCHDLRDNRGDPMEKKTKKTKVNWAKKHPCKNCKLPISMLLCPHCGKVSV